MKCKGEKCHREFEPTHHLQKWCSPECRTRHYEAAGCHPNGRQKAGPVWKMSRGERRDHLEACRPRQKRRHRKKVTDQSSGCLGGAAPQY